MADPAIVSRLIAGTEEERPSALASLTPRERDVLALMARGMSRTDAVEVGRRRLYPYELIDAGAAAADALDSSVFFLVVLRSQIQFDRRDADHLGADGGEQPGEEP